MISGLDDVKVPDLVMSAVSGTSAGLRSGILSTTLLGGASVGLIVGLLVYSGISVWRAYKEKTNNPYQYLSKVEKAGAVLSFHTSNKKL